MIQDLHGWYLPCNYSMESVMRVQLNTRFTWVVTSMELFDG
jgi:hypothetical protein